MPGFQSWLRGPGWAEIERLRLSPLRFSSSQRVHVYLGLKVGIWEPLWALSIYHIPTWTLWDGGTHPAGLRTWGGLRCFRFASAGLRGWLPTVRLRSRCLFCTPSRPSGQVFVGGRGHFPVATASQRISAPSHRTTGFDIRTHTANDVTSLAEFFQMGPDPILIAA